MENSIKMYRGKAIDDDVKNQILEIVDNSIYSDRIKKCYYASGMQEFNSPTDDLVVYIGTDWFIQYYDSEAGIDIIDWVSKKNITDKLKMTSEMLKVFKEIFINSNGKMIFASMRHDTAFQLYYSLLENDYLCEYEHRICFDVAEPKLIISILNKYLRYLFKKYDSLYVVLNIIDDDKFFFSRHQNTILHNIKFTVTDKFIHRYSK